MKNIILFALTLILSGCTAMSWTSHGERALARKDYKRATQVLTFALDQDETPWKSYYLRAYAYLGLYDYDKALDDCQKSLALSKYACTYILLGEIYLAKREMANALDNLKLAQALTPENPWVYWYKGLSYLYLTDYYHLALLEFQNALKISPDNVNFQAGYSRALFCTGDYQKNLSFLHDKIENNKLNLTLKTELLAALVYSPNSSRSDWLSALRIAQIERTKCNSPILYQIIARAYALMHSFEKALYFQKIAIEKTKTLDDPFKEIYLKSLSEELIIYGQEKLPSPIDIQSQRLFLLYRPDLQKIGYL